MRERAERIGARLKVLMAHASGTEVDLRVPGRIAFESSIWVTGLDGYLDGTRKSKIEKKQKGENGQGRWLRARKSECSASMIIP